MSDCEGCGAPMKPAHTACAYCLRTYPRTAAPAYDERTYQQQSLAALYNAQQQCNSSGLYAMLGNQQNSMMAYGGPSQINPWGWAT